MLNAACILGEDTNMWASQETLEQIAELAMKDDYLLSMLVEWNETQDFGEQDMIFCKIMHYAKDKIPDGEKVN